MEDFTLENSIEKLNTNRICLLDADYIKYIICSRRHKEIMLGKTEEESIEDKVITLTKDFLLTNIFGKIEDPIIFCFSGKSYNTFRDKIAFSKQYKAGRKTEEAYVGEALDSVKVMKYIMDNYVSLLFEDLEADDIVSALQAEDTYIMSKDKDLKQVPGFHYDFSKNEIYEISNTEALYHLSYQLLCGDSTDNIPGFPGYGEKKSQNFLEGLNPKFYILHILKLYQMKFGIFKGTDMFNETWNLVKMRDNRGEYFQSKYRKMFDTKEHVKRKKSLLK